MYDKKKVFIPLDWKFSKYLIKNLKIEKKSLVLDIGSGQGEKIAYLKDGFKNVVCIDIKFMCVKKLNQSKFLAIQADAINLPFKNSVFDLVTSFHVIEHLEDYFSFLKEVKRVLKQGGIFIFSTPNCKRISSLLYRFFSFKKIEYPMNPDHKFEFDEDSLLELLGKIKFDHYYIYSIGFLRIPFFELNIGPRCMNNKPFRKFCDQFIVICKK